MHFRKSSPIAIAAAGIFGGMVQPIPVQQQPVTRPPAAQTAPYSGTAPRVPVVVPAVNFDKGGEGVAYHDRSSGNLGGQYRKAEGVDIYRSTDSAFSPYQVAGIQAGEWMNYTLNVPTSGKYDLSIRASNATASGAAGAFHLEVDGANVTGTIRVPTTGSWTTYQWFGKPSVALSAGKHVVRVVVEAEGFNATALSVQASSAGGYAGTPYGGTPAGAPGTFPAINYDKGGEGVAYHDLSSGNLGGLYRTSESVDIYPSGDTAVAPNKVQNFQTGEWMNYTVNVPADGNYDLGIRSANNLASGASGAFHIEVDGANVTGTVSVPITGGWDNYQWFGKKGVPLSAGKHVLTVFSEKQWFDVSAVTVLASSNDSGSTTSTPYSGTPVAVPGSFAAINYDKGGEGVAYHDLSSGNLGGLYRTGESVDIYPSADSAVGPYKVQNFQTGEWMKYTVNVAAAGNYDLGIRSANNLGNGASGAFHIEVDGVNVTGTVSVPITGGWDNYQWFGKKAVPMTAGKHVVKLVSEQQWFDVSALTVLASGSGGSTGGGSSDGGSTGGGSQPPATALWSAGMEAGNMLEWYSDGGGMEHNGMGTFVEGDGVHRDTGPDGEYSEASKERAHSGSWSAKLSITGSEGSVRLWRWKEPMENRELYYSAWYFIPQDYTVGSGGWNNIFQFKSSTPGGKNDPFFLLLWNNQNGAMHAGLQWWNPPVEGPQPGQSGKKTWMFPTAMPVGRWFNLEMRYVCAGDFTGAIQVWQDGVQMIDLEGVKTRYPDGNCITAVTNYATNVSPQPYYYYVDDVVISRSRIGR